MALKSLICLLFISTTYGASLPFHGGYDWHFNKMGVQLDLALKDQTNPLLGGKAHIELPVSKFEEMLEMPSSQIKQLITPLVKQIFEKMMVEKLVDTETINKLWGPLNQMYEEIIVKKLNDVKTIKTDITFNGEKVLEGTIDISVDYTIVHKNGSEEKGKMTMEAKSESDKIITYVQVVSSSKNTSNQIVYPFQITMVCSLPNTCDIIFTGSSGKLVINLAGDKNEVSSLAVLEYLGHQYKYSAALSFMEKYLTMTYQAPRETPKDIVVRLNMLNNFPEIEISGSVPNTFLFEEGVFKIELVRNNMFDYEVRHTFNRKEILNFNIAITSGKLDMTLKYGNWLMQKARVVVEHTNRMVRLVFPGTNTFNLNKELEVKMEYEPTNEESLLGGGRIYLVALKESVPFIKSGGYMGLTVNAEKYEVLLSDFYIKVVNSWELGEFAQMFNVNTDYVCYGQCQYRPCTSPYPSPYTTSSPLMNCFDELSFNGKISVDRINKFGLINRVEVGGSCVIDNTEVFSLSLSTSETPLSLHISLPRIIKKMLKMQDSLRINMDYVVSGEEKKLTARCNYNDMVVVGKMTPTMLSYEFLVGQVTHMKYTTEVNGLKDIKTNSFLVSGKVNLQLHETSFIYKMLRFISPSYVCFKDLTTYYQLNVIDLAAGKVDVKVNILKDHFEVGRLEMTTVDEYKLSIFSPCLIKEVLNLKDFDHLEMKLACALLNGERIITASTNYNDMQLRATISREKMICEVLAGQVSHVKYSVEIEGASMSDWTSFPKVGKLNLHLHENIYLPLICYVSPSYACFKDLTIKYNIDELSNIKLSVKKDSIEMFQLEVASIGDNICAININSSPLVHLVFGNNQVSVVPQIKSVAAITVVFTFKNFSILENTLGIELLIKQVSNKVLLTWNMNKLTKGFVEMKLVGSGTTLLGSYELFHHLNWNIINLMNMNLVWNGKALSTGLTVLKNPMVGEGNLTLNNYVVDMTVVGKQGPETCKLIVKTSPFKIALLPFFQWP